MPRLDAGSCETSRSPILMEPLVTVSSPAIIRSVVVLPQPGGAQQRDQLARLDGQVDALDRRDAFPAPRRVGLDQVGEGQALGGRRCGRRQRSYAIDPVITLTVLPPMSNRGPRVVSRGWWPVAGSRRRGRPSRRRAG